jgi:predicted Ser/Thr protein kinase
MRVDDVYQSWRISPSDIELLHPPIAKGATGVVYKAIYKGAIVAVKTMVIDVGESRANLRNEFKREIQNLW